MAFSHRIVSGINIIDIEGSMDLYSVPDLKKFFRSLARNENTKLLLVLTRVNFMDSTGLGMFANLFFECQQKNIPLKLANLSHEAKRVFALTKLEKTFCVYETEAEAMRDFN